LCYDGLFQAPYALIDPLKCASGILVDLRKKKILKMRMVDGNIFLLEEK